MDLHPAVGLPSIVSGLYVTADAHCTAALSSAGTPDVTTISVGLSRRPSAPVHTFMSTTPVVPAFSRSLGAKSINGGAIAVAIGFEVIIMGAGCTAAALSKVVATSSSLTKA